MDVDLNNFDFYGNELARPDLTLETDHFLCKRSGNDSQLFRKFAGLIKETLTHFDFWRIDRLKSFYYKSESIVEPEQNDDEPEQNDDEPLNNPYAYSESLKTSKIDADSNLKLKKNFPQMFKKEYFSAEQLELGELFVVDLLLTVIPSIQGTLISEPADVAGILLLMLLKEIKDDFFGYFDEFKEFYELMQKFAACSFELPAMTSAKKISSKILIEELFQLAVKRDLPYTLELFYAMDMLDFGDNLLFKFVLENANCPLVLNRFFDFVSWNEGEIDGQPKIHFIYENYCSYLNILFEYEAGRIDWRAVGRGGRTLLGKMLPFISKKAFLEGDQQDDIKNFDRALLKNFLSHVTIRESAGTFLTGEKDILMECFDNETEGLRLLAEYADNAADMLSVIEEYLQRIIANWKSDTDNNLALLKVFKYLVKKTERGDSFLITPILIEAFDFINERMAKDNANDQGSRSNRNSRNSNSRSISGGDFFKSFLFVDTNTATINNNSNAAAVPKSPRSPRANLNLEMMKFIAQEVQRIVEKENSIVRDVVFQWNIVILGHENKSF